MNNELLAVLRLYLQNNLKENKDVEESFTYKIAKAKLAGKDSVKIGNKVHPVKMDKKTANKIVNEFEDNLQEKKEKIKTDFDKGTGEPGYLRGRSEKERKANQKLTRQLKRAKTQKAKEKIYAKINRQREKERESMAEGSIKVSRHSLIELINEAVEAEKLAIILEKIEELEEKKRRKRRKRRKSTARRKKKKTGKSSKGLSSAVKKSLDKKADRRGLTRGSVYAEFRKGLAAYYTSGSRKGMSPHQWAHARVNSANPSKSWAVVKKKKGGKKKKK